MEKQNVTFWLSIASFAISGILAVIKLVEFSSANKIRIKADAALTSLPELGNTITLLGLPSELLPCNSKAPCDYLCFLSSG